MGNQEIIKFQNNGTLDIWISMMIKTRCEWLVILVSE